MKDNNWLADRFQESRTHLEAVAYRLLGSRAEADDAVQEAWLRLIQEDSVSIENLRGWLTTVVARVCLDRIRSNKVRHKYSQKEALLEQELTDSPDATLQIADSMGPALLIVLETLAPPERVAFVLHDLFDVEFESIAGILGRSEVSTRQLASRARRKVQGNKTHNKDDTGQEIVSAFLKASREGNFESLLKLLDPNIVLRADDSAIQTTAANKAKGAPQFEKEMRDPASIAELFKGRAVGAQLAFINGLAGATWIGGGKPRVAFTFQVESGKITEIGIIMTPDDLGEMEIILAPDGGSHD